MTSKPRFSRVTHDYRSNAIASANAAKTAKSQSLQREWGNAFQEINSSRDQEPVKYVAELLSTDFGPGATNSSDDIWIVTPLPDVVIGAFNTDDNDVRQGRSIQIKALDMLWELRYTYEQNNVRCGTPQIRRIIAIDMQPRSSNITTANIDLLLTPVDTSANELNITSLYNLDNQLRFKIIDDTTKHAMVMPNDSTTSIGHITWSDHIDLDMQVTFDGTQGDRDEITQGKILVAYCFNRQTGSTTDRQAATLNVNKRVSFTDS